MRGALYNWYVIDSPRLIAGAGWHVPTAAEYWTLQQYLDPGSGYWSSDAGGKMKETGFANWLAPNTGATNSSKFTAHGFGYRTHEGAFIDQMEGAYFWQSDDYADYGYYAYINYDYDTLYTSQPAMFLTVWYKKAGMSVRLIKDSTTLSDGETGTYIGNDGKIYQTICIGTQEWMSENLAETQYRDNYPINVVTTVDLWKVQTEGAMCYYDNTPDGDYEYIKALIQKTKVLVNHCTEGVYLRWWFNGWHYFNFQNSYDITLRTEHKDIQVTQYYSIISKIERPTRVTSDYLYKISIEGITAENMNGFLGMLLAEQVEQYELESWREVDITRSEHTIRYAGERGYKIEFEITRKDLPEESAVFHKRQKLYIGDVLCDIDDDEVIAVNKQVNNIAELQDRQSDFTATFKIRKTRPMRELFELSGEVGSQTTFPYEEQPCRLIQDGIEVFQNGYCILDRVDSEYYHVAIYSGNLNFFKELEDRMITDLLLTSANHNWNAQDQALSNVNDYDYCYPLCEPSDDGNMLALTDDGDRCEVYGGWLWPFVKVKAIFDEIILNAGYTATGDILTDETFTKLFIPISNRSIDYINTKQYLYNVHVQNRRVMDWALGRLDWRYGATITSYFGNSLWRYGSQFFTTFGADYTFRVTIHNPYGVPTNVYLYVGGVQVAEMTDDGYYTSAFARRYVVTYTMLTDSSATFYCTYNNGCKYYAIECINISTPVLGYGDDVIVKNHLPELTQTDFMKMVCNLLGLIPEADPRTRNIYFWNYRLLYDNIPLARDWSAFLSEQDDEVEFRFGDFAQKNFLRYKESDDVKPDTGTGTIQVDDVSLEQKKDVVEIPLSTCDEVTVLTDIQVSRINFNTYNPTDVAYDMETEIDPRIVYIDEIYGSVSPPETKTFGIRDTLIGGISYDSVNPKKATSLEIAFSSLSRYYDGLTFLLDKTKLRRAKFNLPAYEVAGLKHYVPIYLSQYRAYFYVNKIENYVSGELCTIELIEL